MKRIIKYFKKLRIESLEQRLLENEAEMCALDSVGYTSPSIAKKIAILKYKIFKLK